MICGEAMFNHYWAVYASSVVWTWGSCLPRSTTPCSSLCCGYGFDVHVILNVTCSIICLVKFNPYMQAMLYCMGPD
jgi:hypothetical protein